MSSLSPYINRMARNQLVFTSYEVGDITYVDIGQLLSRKIETSIDKKRLPMIAEIEISSIMNECMSQIEELGNFIAIKNIGILFEPALQIDVKSFLDKCSRRTVSIANHNRELKKTRYYLAKNNTRYVANLTDITYKTI